MYNSYVPIHRWRHYYNTFSIRVSFKIFLSFITQVTLLPEFSFEKVLVLSLFLLVLPSSSVDSKAVRVRKSSKPYQYCHQNYCANGGTCIIRNSRPTCLCVSHFSGHRCQEKEPPRKNSTVIKITTNVTNEAECTKVQGLDPHKAKGNISTPQVTVDPDVEAKIEERAEEARKVIEEKVMKEEEEEGKKEEKKEKEELEKEKEVEKEMKIEEQKIEKEEKEKEEKIENEKEEKLEKDNEGETEEKKMKAKEEKEKEEKEREEKEKEREKEMEREEKEKEEKEKEEKEKEEKQKEEKEKEEKEEEKDENEEEKYKEEKEKKENGGNVIKDEQAGRLAQRDDGVLGIFYPMKTKAPGGESQTDGTTQSSVTKAPSSSVSQPTTVLVANTSTPKPTPALNLSRNAAVTVVKNEANLTEDIRNTTMYKTISNNLQNATKNVTNAMEAALGRSREIEKNEAVVEKLSKDEVNRIAGMARDLQNATKNVTNSMEAALGRSKEIEKNEAVVEKLSKDEANRIAGMARDLQNATQNVTRSMEVALGRSKEIEKNEAVVEKLSKDEVNRIAGMSRDLQNATQNVTRSMEAALMRSKAIEKNEAMMEKLSQEEVNRIASLSKGMDALETRVGQLDESIKGSLNVSKTWNSVMQNASSSVGKFFGVVDGYLAAEEKRMADRDMKETERNLKRVESEAKLEAVSNRTAASVQSISVPFQTISVPPSNSAENKNGTAAIIQSLPASLQNKSESSVSGDGNKSIDSKFDVTSSMEAHLPTFPAQESANASKQPPKEPLDSSQPTIEGSPEKDNGEKTTLGPALQNETFNSTEDRVWETAVSDISKIIAKEELKLNDTLDKSSEVPIDAESSKNQSEMDITRFTTVYPTETPTERITTVRPTETLTERLTTVRSTETPTERLTTVRPTETPTERLTTVRSTETPTERLTTVRPTETPTERLTTVRSTETPTERLTTVRSTETPTERLTTVRPTETPTERLTTVRSTETPTERLTTVRPTEITTEMPTTSTRLTTLVTEATTIPEVNTPNTAEEQMQRISATGSNDIPDSAPPSSTASPQKTNPPSLSNALSRLMKAVSGGHGFKLDEGRIAEELRALNDFLTEIYGKEGWDKILPLQPDIQILHSVLVNGPPDQNSRIKAETRRLEAFLPRLT
ncbi:hypothetical protein CAPTEDRAFT_198995 [Capitella teleta]|uniref:EGF-like domain-containing protein n=1 Tax=Capitella teleta TaxID=283909 RepID=R7TWE6_CAPTE|nr:hypothetical protein CAPTEDRAFT_198995 [Capitella teleta]|eukprot:ELT95761.1 hypothetical protein CAPTEDRAFT_198995 [Capitella teleta]